MWNEIFVVILKLDIQGYFAQFFLIESALHCIIKVVSKMVCMWTDGRQATPIPPESQFINGIRFTKWSNCSIIHQSFSPAHSKDKYNQCLYMRLQHGWWNRWPEEWHMTDSVNWSILWDSRIGQTESTKEIQALCLWEFGNKWSVNWPLVMGRFSKELVGAIP